ncbi:putative exported protein [Halobacteriovorax marinus SJ]|uniref:Exported protein n=1 Tax=Halobacteriovorax marinus (strain ATCC BAA-682 / DSM 15412 / SJ) TaxID=862908 RepID=E1WYA0_HALMS|nr:hypothetical protein [Halobacteriovorax marinus]CBW25948.1 putative exported protein [Halobacteriovorax marinus SJ]
MKKLILLILMTSSASAQTYITDYKLTNSDNNECPQNITVIENETEIRMNLSSEIGAYFNKDSSAGDLLIENIDQGEQVIESRNTSHGTTSKTEYVAVSRLNKFFVEKTIKFGRLGTSKSFNRLALEFEGIRLQIDMHRSYREFLGDSWSKDSYCTYFEVE